MKDVARYLGWSMTELSKNTTSLDLDSMKEEIAIKFAYNNKERKKIGLAKR